MVLARKWHSPNLRALLSNGGWRRETPIDGRPHRIFTQPWERKAKRASDRRTDTRNTRYIAFIVAWDRSPLLPPVKQRTEGPGRGGDWRNVSAEAHYSNFLPSMKKLWWLGLADISLLRSYSNWGMYRILSNFLLSFNLLSLTSFLSDTGKQILLTRQANLEKRDTQTVIFSRRKTIRNWMSAVKVEQETSISAAHYRSINFAWGIEKRTNVPEPYSDFFLKDA